MASFVMARIYRARVSLHTPFFVGEEMLKDPALTLRFKADPVDVAKSGDVGYTAGSYTMTATDPSTHKVIHDRGTYVTTYRKQADGSWKAEANIATSSVPSMPIPEKKKQAEGCASGAPHRGDSGVAFAGRFASQCLVIRPGLLFSVA